MKILYYILAFSMGCFFRMSGKSRKKHDQPNTHEDELIRREQEAETFGDL